MRAAASLLAILALTACDVAPAPAVQPAAAVRERPEPVSWNPEAGGFDLAGKPLRAVKLWTFDGSTEGFTAAGQVIPDNDIGLRLTLAAPPLRSPRGLAVDGSRYSTVLVRLTRLKAGGGWNGALYYSTPEHGESGAFFGKPLAGADPAVGETTILIYDMARLAAGGEDWTLSLVDQIRLDLEDRPGGEFLVRQVAIAEKVDLSTLTPST